MLGNIYLQQSDLTNAEQDFAAAVGIDKNADIAHMQLARIYSTTGRLPQAIESAKGVLQRRTDYLGAYILLGTLYQQAGAIRDAQETYQKALEKNPNYAPALNNLAWLYCENGGNLDMALGMAQRAKASMPTDPSVSDTLAWIQYNKGLYSSAAQELRNLVRQIPANGLYQYHLGMALLKTGDSVEARKSLARALETNPTAEYAHSAKSILAQLSGKST
jgi:Tfp pilus assembly protein PilF